MPPSHVTISVDRHPAVILPLGARVDLLAADCGFAASTFVRGSGWGKRELAAWLVGRYGPIALLARTAHGVELADRAPPSEHADFSGLPALIAGARRRALTALRAALTPDGDLGFAVEGIQRGHVVRVSDTLGQDGWLPVDMPRMHLSDRVVSLVTAQRLTSQEAFDVAWAPFDDLLEEVEVDELWNATA
jgi:hypothetical protein